MIQYSKQFIKDFSRIVAPLMRLTQKNVKFEWDNAYELSFQKLKERLTLVDVLTLPSNTEGYTVYCDASHVGLRCVLMQNGKVVA